jgi:hypothetical protein
LLIITQNAVILAPASASLHLSDRRICLLSADTLIVAGEENVRQ